MKKILVAMLIATMMLLALSVAEDVTKINYSCND